MIATRIATISTTATSSHRARSTQVIVDTGRFDLTGTEVTSAVYRPRAPRSRWAAAWVAALVCTSTSLAGTARAQESGGAEAEARPVRLDLVRGPLVTSSRITGLGGAYAGVADGIDGVWRNPASLANRGEDGTDWFDYDLTFDFTLVDGDEVDFDGDGLEPGGSRSFQAISLGLSFQFDMFAVGAVAALYGYNASEGAATDEAGTPAEDRTVSYADVLLGAGYAFAGGQWIIAAGAQLSILGITAPDVAGGAPVELVGSALDLGLLHRPRGSSWRLGGRVRLGAELEAAPDHDGFEAAAVASVSAAVPWQIGLGWSLYLPADPLRQYNRILRTRAPRLNDRRYLLIAAEVVVTGATDGESLEALAAGEERPAGRDVTTSLHVGAEGEVFHDRVRARFGSYFEPGRVLGSQLGRLHLTGGVEIRLFQFVWMWKVTFGFDLAPGWENVSFGVGFWK